MLISSTLYLALLTLLYMGINTMIIGNIKIPISVLAHRFLNELITELSSDGNQLKNSTDRVFGTHNTQKPELYGFIGDIESHIDNKGFVYFMPLNDIEGTFYNAEGENIHYRQGDVIRMDDRIMHGVRQNGYVAAMFIGAFEQPKDDTALKLFNEAICQLSNKDSYKKAPRWLNAPIANDECYKLVGDHGERDLITNTNEPILCSTQCCNDVAIKLDSKFPYFWDYNFCKKHNAK